MRFTPFAAVFCICLAACGADPRDFRITEKNKGSFLKDIGSMKGLTVEEAGLLFAYQMRSGMAEALGGTPLSPVGKTVGELIEEQRQFGVTQEKKKAEDDRLAAEAKAKAEEKANQLRGAIRLTVFDKSFRPSNPRAGSYDDYITIECAYENVSNKTIRAFTGTVQFNDLFGKKIFESSLTISDPIEAGSKGTWSGSIEYNQFIDEHQALRNASLDDIKVVWLPEQVLFADGTSLGAPTD